MGVTYPQAKRAKEAIEDKLLDDPNIVSVGIIQETDGFGNITDNYAIKIGVISLEVYNASVREGKSVIPLGYRLNLKDGSEEPNGTIHIHVVATGQINALCVSDLPNAVDDATVLSRTQRDNVLVVRKRPCAGGYSIGHFAVTAGTLGLVLESQSAIDGLLVRYILSNNHVLANSNLGRVGDCILQPAVFDGGRQDLDTIARLSRWVPLVTSGYNLVDAAIAEVVGDPHLDETVLAKIRNIGVLNEVIDPFIGMEVEKSGRITGYTFGRVTSTDYNVKVNFGALGSLRFKNQICTTGMSDSGDSGACLVESKTKQPVGMLFAGDGSESFFNPLRSVLTLLSGKLPATYPNGETHILPSIPTLKVAVPCRSDSVKAKHRSFSTVANCDGASSSMHTIFSKHRFNSHNKLSNSSFSNQAAVHKTLNPWFCLLARGNGKAKITLPLLGGIAMLFSLGHGGRISEESQFKFTKS